MHSRGLGPDPYELVALSIFCNLTGPLEQVTQPLCSAQHQAWHTGVSLKTKSKKLAVMAKRTLGDCNPNRWQVDSAISAR